MMSALSSRLFRFARRVRRRLLRSDNSRDTMASALKSFSALSESPRTVFDVGAAHGTPALYRAFPNSEIVLIEPLAEFHPALSEVAKHLTSARIVPLAAGGSIRTETINVHPDLVGSSFHLEPEDDESVNGIGRRVQITTLDGLVEEFDLQPPFFIKVDTQGHESEVLRGATGLLSETIGVVLELSLFDFFADAPSFSSLIQQMADLGFVLYDIFDRRYRLLDGALGQFDALFVPKQSDLRRSHRYASDEQRRNQTVRIRRSLRGTRTSDDAPPAAVHTDQR